MKAALSYCSFRRDGRQRFSIAFRSDADSSSGKDYSVHVLDDRTVELFEGVTQIESLPNTERCRTLLRVAEASAKDAATLLGLKYQSPEWRQLYWSIQCRVRGWYGRAKTA